MSKLDRDIQTIIDILLSNNVSAIYPAEIALLLQCPAEAVETVLSRMVEEDKVEHMYELHCRECGGVMSSFESPEFLTSSPFPCEHCFTQMESIDMNNTVSTFYPIKRNNA